VLDTSPANRRAGSAASTGTRLEIVGVFARPLLEGARRTTGRRTYRIGEHGRSSTAAATWPSTASTIGAGAYRTIASRASSAGRQHAYFHDQEVPGPAGTANT
jgi:hypothetical protein